LGGLCCWAFEEITGWAFVLLWVLVAEQPSFPEHISFDYAFWLSSFDAKSKSTHFLAFASAQLTNARSFYMRRQETRHWDA